MYERILVPLDGSLRAEAIMPHVEALAQRFESHIIFIQILEPAFAMVTPYDGVPYYDENIERQRHADAESYLTERVVELRDKGLSAEACLEYSTDVVRSILQTSLRENCDLIAMASHGRTGLSRVFYGSVAAGVLHGASRPLLVIRAEDEVAE